MAERRNGGERRHGGRRSEDDGPQETDLLRAIVESSEDAILSETLDGTIVSWNAAAERLYGYTAAEAVGCDVAMLVPDGHEGEIGEILRRVGAGEKITRYITLRKRSDGHIIEILLSVSPILGETGEITGASSIAHEVTSDERLSVTMELLAKRVHDLKNNIIVLTDGIQHFTTADQVGDKIVEGQRELESKIKWRTVLGLVVAAIVASGVGGGSAWLVQREAHRNAVDACHQRANSNQAIRDIVDKSQQIQIDPSRLSPAAREIINEFARAQQQSNSPSFRDFVYSKTPIPDCAKV